MRGRDFLVKDPPRCALFAEGYSQQSMDPVSSIAYTSSRRASYITLVSGTSFDFPRMTDVPSRWVFKTRNSIQMQRPLLSYCTPPYVCVRPSPQGQLGAVIHNRGKLWHFGSRLIFLGLRRIVGTFTSPAHSKLVDSVMTVCILAGGPWGLLPLTYDTHILDPVWKHQAPTSDRRCSIVILLLSADPWPDSSTSFVNVFKPPVPYSCCAGTHPLSPHWMTLRSN